MFDFSLVTQWFDQLLQVTLGCPEWLAILIECVLVGVAVLGGYALLAIVLIFMERKVCAYFQCRLGPMRVGYWGLLQVFADVLKMLIKEIFIVDKADTALSRCSALSDNRLCRCFLVPALEQWCNGA